MQIKHVLDGVGAWERLVKMRMSPLAGLKLSRYAKRVAAEFDAANVQRMRLLQQYGEEEESGVWSVKQGSENFGPFMAEFIPLVDSDAELAPCELTLEAVLEDLEKHDTNSLQPTEIAMLEPFFKRDDADGA